jgi:hypothetical protein
MEPCPQCKLDALGWALAAAMFAFPAGLVIGDALRVPDVVAAVLLFLAVVSGAPIN